ncbi:MAG: VOC family protein [Thermomicrobiales bacterium]|nr:VOC family protein [Thermomicrobiales bacterium]
MTQPIAPCLWFDNNAEEAVDFYISVFKDSRVDYVGHFTQEGPAPDAPVLYIDFTINGQPFQAINGGPLFTFSEAISFSITCADQQEVDYYWDRLTADGGEPGSCGWLKDKYGVSWQVTPQRFYELLQSDDQERAGQTVRKMLTMGKLDIAELEAAYNA